MTRKRYEIDMCRGPMLKNIVRFAIPLVLSGVMQLLYSTADLVVVGQFVSDTALAAVGSTGSVTSLVVVLFSGLSVGVNLVVSRLRGAEDNKGIHEAVHTAIALALIGGVVFAIVGFAISAPLLRMVSTPDDVFQMALTYIRISFLGMPISMFYGFGSAVLYAYGDTKRPFYFATCSGALNVALNLLFVLVFHMDVAGVAIATLLSQLFSATLLFFCLTRMEGPARLFVRGIRCYRDKVLKIAHIGLPSGLQSSMFSIAGVLIQASINSLGKEAMIACTTVGNLERIICLAISSLGQAVVCFVSQNRGAGQFRRIRRLQWMALGIFGVITPLLAGGVLMSGDVLLQIYTDEPTVLVKCKEALLVSMLTFPINGILEALDTMVRGLGYAVTSMAASMAGICGFRLLWIYTVFAATPSLTTLYLSYPVGWATTALIDAIALVVIWRKLPKENAPLPELGGQNL